MSKQIIGRPATDRDWWGIWAVLEPSIRDGSWFPIPQNFNADQGRAFWCHPAHHVFVGESGDGEIAWTYYTCPIQLGGGSHVANAGYAVAQFRFGKGLGHAMVEHSLETARAENYRAMMYTAVLSTNERAVHLYTRSKFRVLTRIPEGYLHPFLGYVDTLVLHRTL